MADLESDCLSGLVFKLLEIMNILTIVRTNSRGHKISNLDPRLYEFIPIKNNQPSLQD